MRRVVKSGSCLLGLACAFCCVISVARFIYGRQKHLFPLEELHTTVQDTLEDNVRFIHLVQQPIVSSNIYGQSRLNESLETIIMNLNHKNVFKLYIIEETLVDRAFFEKYLNNTLGKVQFLPFGRTPNFSEIFQLINSHVVSCLQPGHIWMYANMDIILGEGFELLYGKLRPKHILSLSRYPFRSSCKKNKNMCKSWEGSSDCYISTGAIDLKIIKKVNYFQHTLGVENVILYEFVQAGYKASNPCFTIKIYHNHCSNQRRKYAPRINRGGRSVQPRPSNLKL